MSAADETKQFLPPAKPPLTPEQIAWRAEAAQFYEDVIATCDDLGEENLDEIDRFRLWRYVTLGWVRYTGGAFDDGERCYGPFFEITMNGGRVIGEVWGRRPYDPEAAFR